MTVIKKYEIWFYKNNMNFFLCNLLYRQKKTKNHSINIYLDTKNQ